jgi:hypothetical protein
MQTARRLIPFSMLLIAVGISACNKTGFDGQTPDPKRPKQAQVVIPTGTITLGCTLAPQQAALGNELAGGVPVAVARSCSDSMDVSGQVLAKRPLDLVFVLDVTKSMQPSIDTVKENIVEFTQLIGTKGWDVRYAAVAFRDPPGSTPGHFNDPNYELLYSTQFMTGDGIRAEISSGANQWVANDLSDNQEGGQAGLQRALDLLSSGRRADSEAAILYVSDAPAFKDKDHWNFTVNDLAARMATQAKLRFFHSTLAVDHYKYVDLPSEGPWVGSTNYKIAKNQMEDLRRLSSKEGVWLPFPLDKNTFLKNFADQFDTVSNKLTVECALVEAKVVDGSGQSVAGFVTQNPLGEQSGNEAVRLTSGIGVAGQFTYSEKRCCVRREAGQLGTRCEKGRDGTTRIVIQ